MGGGAHARPKPSSIYCNFSYNFYTPTPSLSTITSIPQLLTINQCGMDCLQYRPKVCWTLMHTTIRNFSNIFTFFYSLLPSIVYYSQQKDWDSISGCHIQPCTVIRFVSMNAKFGICTVVGLNGTLVETKIRTLKCLVRILASTSVPFRLTTVQMPNLVQIETKPITVWEWFGSNLMSYS
jgi:hypothetical protein